MNNISKHVSILSEQDISNICHPLKQLKINYYSHVRVDTEKNIFSSSMCSNKFFMEKYLHSKFYNYDAHMADNETFGNIILWDNLDLCGKSKEVELGSGAFGVHHTCTIRDKTASGIDYFHFGSDIPDLSFNQVYLNNIDLIKVFISEFQKKLQHSKPLLDSLRFKYQIANNAKFIIKPEATVNLQKMNALRNNFHKVIQSSETNHSAAATDIATRLLSKLDPTLTPQQLKCISLVIVGHSIKTISSKLKLSPRTVEHYLEKVRQKYGCHNMRQLIAYYFEQLLKINF
jgi:DNA-binding CsgD family transcriptional regulator